MNKLQVVAGGVGIVDGFEEREHIIYPVVT
jgi:hypothetical protein